MSLLLDGLQGVLCDMDDILAFRQSYEQHDARLDSILNCLFSLGITFNSTKCKFSKNMLIFLCHVIDQNGISPDSSRTAATNQMNTPK